MPRIFDNIESRLLPALTQTLNLAQRADFCVGYFNLRGWKHLAPVIAGWPGGPAGSCRLLVGMQRTPEEDLRAAFSLATDGHGIDQQTAIRLKKRLAEEFRRQLTIGAPTNEDEACLRLLSAQLKAEQVVVKLFLRHPLHAKLYLLHRPDPINPIVGYLGSSNLTLAGLAGQGELNIDVLDLDACRKLQQWFDDRWDNKWCLDISAELAEIIDESWAREDLLPPYHIYLKIAYHLSQEARTGLAEFRVPRDFGNQLFEFQTAAVKIAAHHLNQRGGVLIGDVVGLGKTLMATALARIFEDDYFLETLIICPKNLVKMWEDYVARYRLHAKVVSMSRVSSELPDLRRYRIVLIDESHNLRNREGKRYQVIHDYIAKNESRCILLSATPYNKQYQDLSAQLRLFVPEDRDLGIRPEEQIRQLGGETEFIRRHQCPVRSLAAFEKSEYADDWRELMRLYLVRRTRTFIQNNYAVMDPAVGRRYLTFADGSRSYFPARVPLTAHFPIDEEDPHDQYARLFAPGVVGVINALNLPRYGLGNYVLHQPPGPPDAAEAAILDGLSRAGKRLMGFCRTNLFKRLESGGPAFIQSIERHIRRNFIFLYALDNDLPLPIGTQDADLLDTRFSDQDPDGTIPLPWDDDENGADPDAAVDEAVPGLGSEISYRRHGELNYETYWMDHQRRFRWIRSSLFAPSLREDLLADSRALLGILDACGAWNPAQDAKLNALARLLTETHPREKVLIFTQFADTVRYLSEQLHERGIPSLEGVTGGSADPTELAWRFSPESNDRRSRIGPDRELRVLIATDVLSEGQNLQDCAIIVNYDLPWAIIRLIQRAGRVDRIGQQAADILCYSFLPADGVERLLRLRGRVRQRLRENAEVVGTDEAFFEDDSDDQPIIDIYNEKAGIFDGEAETEVDLASYAYQIWKNATDDNPSLRRTIENLPDVVYSTRGHQPRAEAPEGVLIYLRTAEGNDALAWVDREGRSVTQSQLRILLAAACAPDTPPLPRHELHHHLVQTGVQDILSEEHAVGGQLGRPSGARFRTYERLKRHAEEVRGTLWDTEPLHRAIEEIYRYPLRQSATDTLNRQLRSGITDGQLAELVTGLRDDDRLCLIHELVEESEGEPRIICSLGLFAP